MNSLERQLLSCLDALRELPSPGNVRSVRRAVLALRTAADELDQADPYSRGVHALYEYVDTSSRAAVSDRMQWLGGRRSEYENALASALAAARRGGSVYALSCQRDDLGRLGAEIEGLDRPEDREALRSLLSYVYMKNREALGLAVSSGWGSPTPNYRLEMGRTDLAGAGS
ncbi:hypothetical protein BJY24_005294 [Nocardia transvalensis]|uniref:Uncharacterized protein n=1 Tax=Nocardia transvalensis TaxID=37333 RepID=A0A7W9UKK1_9NOCA|nr:hypothetical protein [Nocardia transvalensis]MBB5916382.1 hypothetical protein [Nocardia transvalensis]